MPLGSFGLSNFRKKLINDSLFDAGRLDGCNHFADIGILPFRSTTSFSFLAHIPSIGTGIIIYGH